VREYRFSKPAIIEEITMRVVQGISFPRSGHHFLADSVCKYFSEEMQVYSFNRRKVYNINAGTCSTFGYLPTYLKKNVFCYCEYYGHLRCRTHPCRHPNVYFQKSHDFDLTDDYRDDFNYIVQIRNPLQAFMSYYELCLKKELIEADTYENWHQFLREKGPYYKNMMNKWVEPGEKENLIIIDYDEMMQKPFSVLSRVIRFFEPPMEIDESRIKRLVQSVREPRSAKQFRYYEDGLPELIRALTQS